MNCPKLGKAATYLAIVLFYAYFLPARADQSLFLSGPAQLSQAEITVFDIVFSPKYSGITAPANYHFVEVELAYSNLLEDRNFKLKLDEFTVLVEDEQYVYRPVVAAAQAAEPFFSEHEYLPQKSQRGRLAFLVPKPSNDLALVHYTEEGPLALDLTPQKNTPTAPPPIVDPADAYPLSAAVLNATLTDLFVVDLSLRLQAENPLTSVTYDPHQYILVRDPNGNTYSPVNAPDLLRPLRTSELWAKQTTRGQLAFKLGATRPESLVLEVYGGSEPIQFQIPPDLLRRRTETGMKTAAALTPPPQPNARNQVLSREKVELALVSPDVDRSGSGRREEAAPAAAELVTVPVSRNGLAGRYFSGLGYSELLGERTDPGIDFSWWRPGAAKFPHQNEVAAGEPLWAEWQGKLTTHEEQEITFRLNAPGGGHLYLNGNRLLADVPCGKIKFPECQKPPRHEFKWRFKAGERDIRVAAVRRGTTKANRADRANSAPDGPLLSWRLGNSKRFLPIPESSLSTTMPTGWRRTARQGAQVGLEWLQSSAIEWNDKHRCFGCHVQAQALMGMAIARDNDYKVADWAYERLLEDMEKFQNKNGTWHNGAYVTATQFGAMALAISKLRGKRGSAWRLLRSARYLKKVQHRDGYIKIDHHEPPIDQGSIMTTANARIAFSAASGATSVSSSESEAFKRAENRALQWLSKATPRTNQGRAMRIIGLATGNREHLVRFRETVRSATADLLKHQLKDGGWAEKDGMLSSAYSTGQALYALRVGGQSIASRPFQRGVKWLLKHQLWTGAWPVEAKRTQSKRPTQYAPTMWPVIALVDAFTAVSVTIAEPTANTCLNGVVSLVAQTEGDEKIDSLRFFADGALVGTAENADANGYYRAVWDTASVPPGTHDIRVEAIRDGEVKGEDSTVVYTVAPGGAGRAFGSACGPGGIQLSTSAGPIPGVTSSSQFELIMDASGSMKYRNELIDGRLKIDVAKDTMLRIIDGLPTGANAALRVYGHRIREGRKGDCQDSELVVPFQPLDKEKLRQSVRAIRALGTTPLSYSLAQAGLDLASTAGKKHIILVTDGKEECGGRPPDVAAQLQSNGLNVRVDVVGFALADELTKQDMHRVAELTGGRFFDAQNADGLLRSIQGALAAPYEVLDTDGNRIAVGRVGGEITPLPRGRYTVVVMADRGSTTVSNVVVASSRVTRIELSETGGQIAARSSGPLTESESQAAAKEAGIGNDKIPIIARHTMLGTAFSRISTDALTETDLQRLQKAYSFALENLSTGETARWTNPGYPNSGTITVGVLHENWRNSGRTCREFSHTLSVSGRVDRAVETSVACRDPDGGWVLKK